MRSKRLRRAAVGATALLVAAGLSACHADSDPTGADNNLPTVVASTDAWGSVAQSIAGDQAKVTSIVSGASADPHSFRASPSDTAEVADAALVVYNGGGYDQWIEDVLTSHANVNSIDAYSMLDKAAPDEPQPANEHVFYDLGVAKAVATTIADRLAKIDPAHSGDFHSRAADFNRRADAVEQTEYAIRSTHPGAAVVVTEPVAHYLLESAGLTDKTPADFVDAVEQDTDPAPVDIAAMIDLITGHQVAALIFNDQTATAATRQIRDAAQASGVPIVAVSETLPAGTDYLKWQADTAARLSAALQQDR